MPGTLKVTDSFKKSGAALLNWRCTYQKWQLEHGGWCLSTSKKLDVFGAPPYSNNFSSLWRSIKQCWGPLRVHSSLKCVHMTNYRNTNFFGGRGQGLKSTCFQEKGLFFTISLQIGSCFRVTSRKKHLFRRSLTPRWPLTPYLLRSRVWLYPRIIVSKSHGNTSMYVDTMINF